jgi:hypothetical protein
MGKRKLQQGASIFNSGFGKNLSLLFTSYSQPKKPGKAASTLRLRRTNKAQRLQMQLPSPPASPDLDNIDEKQDGAFCRAGDF